MPKSSWVLGLCCAACLVGCGGGGDGGQQPAPQSAAVARFLPQARAGFILNAVTTQVYGGAPSALVQAPDGGITTLNGYTLSGPAAQVLDIHGDADYAMGRWALGSVTAPGATQATDANSAYHYLAFNFAQAFPDSARLQCDSGEFTRPRYVGGTDEGIMFSGAASGGATLRFDNGEAFAAVDLAIQDDAGGQGVFRAQVGSLRPNRTVHTGGGGEASPNLITVSVGQADVAAYSLQGGYSLYLANGRHFIGVYRFRCA